MNDLRYPIGQFNPPSIISEKMLKQWINTIATFPSRFRNTVENLPEEILSTPYRPEGWTVRQVVHHVADSHMNSYIRFKWALTEDSPTIKAYDEVAWAELPDSKQEPIEISLNILESLHARWTLLLNSMTQDQFARTFTHPATGKSTQLDYNVGMYAWHGEHHLAHVTSLLKRLSML